MGLKKTLYDFCKENNLEDLTCIIHIALLNCISNLSKPQEYVNLSPRIIDSFTGMGEDKAVELLNNFSDTSDIVNKYYSFTCLNNEEFAGSILEKDIENMQNIEIDSCLCCDQEHIYSIENTEFYNISFSVNKNEFIDDLKISSNEIIKEIVVFNTNEEHIDKLANILVSKLKLKSNQEEVKTGLIKYLHSIKKFSGLVADITGDAATTTGNVKQIAEDLSGFSSIKDLFS